MPPPTGAAAATVDTQRLVLSPFEAADEAQLVALFRDDEVRRFLLDGALVDETWVRSEIAASTRRFAAGGSGLFAARERDTQRLVGFCGFRPDHDPPVLELMYGLFAAFWGRGLATEMARAMLTLAFDRHGDEVVRAAVDAPNRASIRVLERLGMTIERESTGAFGPMLHYFITRRTWEPGGGGGAGGGGVPGAVTTG